MYNNIIYNRIFYFIYPFNFTHSFHHYGISTDIQLCGYDTRARIIDMLFYMTPTLYFFLGTVLFLQFLQSTFKSLSFPMKRSTISLVLYAVIILIFTFFFTFSGGEGIGKTIYLSLILSAISSLILYSLMLPPTYYLKNVKNVKPEKYISPILVDPIARSCLKLYLLNQKLVHEYYIYYI